MVSTVPKAKDGPLNPMERFIKTLLTPIIIQPPLKTPYQPICKSVSLAGTIILYSLDTVNYYSSHNIDDQAHH